MVILFRAANVDDFSDGLFVGNQPQHGAHAVTHVAEAARLLCQCHIP